MIYHYLSVSIIIYHYLSLSIIYHYLKLSVHLFHYLSIYPTICPFISLSIHLSLDPTICPSIPRPTHLYLYIYIWFIGLPRYQAPGHSLLELQTIVTDDTNPFPLVGVCAGFLHVSDSHGSKEGFVFYLSPQLLSPNTPNRAHPTTPRFCSEGLYIQFIISKV